MSFLATANATANCRLGVMDVTVMNMRVRLNIFKDFYQHVFEDKYECFFIDVVDEMIKKALPAILKEDPLGTMRICGLI